MKGGTSRVIRQEFPDLWAEGYFAETLGQFEEAALRRYIREQQCPWPEEAATPPQPRSRRRNS